MTPTIAKTTQQVARDRFDAAHRQQQLFFLPVESRFHYTPSVQADKFNGRALDRGFGLSSSFRLLTGARPPELGCLLPEGATLPALAGERRPGSFGMRR